MKKIFCTCILLLTMFQANALEWTEEQLNQANTAKDVTTISDEEKKVIMYVNLVRLYPQLFWFIEINNYPNERGAMISASNFYFKTLKDDLTRASATHALVFSESMQKQARCWAEESGRLGLTGHDRQTCTKTYKCECCTYGTYKNDARHIVISLLIDNNVPDLGHRRNLLNRDITTIGAAIAPHAKFDYCCVIDSDNRSLQYLSQEQKTSTPTAAAVTTSATPTQEKTQAETLNTVSQTATTQNAMTQATATAASITNYQNTSADSIAANAPNTGLSWEETYEQLHKKTKYRFYEYAGRNAISFVNLACSYDVSGRSHYITAGILGFRAKKFGMSLLDVEFGIYPFSKSFGWKPSMELYFPVSKGLSINVYAGASVDATKVWDILSNNYLYDKDNFYASVFGGLSFNCNMPKWMPIEFFGEYRYPFKGDFQKEGIYTGIKIRFQKPTKQDKIYPQKENDSVSEE